MAIAIPATIRNLTMAGIGTVALAGGFTSGAGAITGNDRSPVQRGVMGAVGLTAAGLGIAALGAGGRGLPAGPGKAVFAAGLIVAGIGGSVGAVSIDG
jgi:hypothetical protein